MHKQQSLHKKIIHKKKPKRLQPNNVRFTQVFREVVSSTYLRAAALSLIGFQSLLAKTRIHFHLKNHTTIFSPPQVKFNSKQTIGIEVCVDAFTVKQAR
mmetsp:Transcript_1634/g.3404  ORF Transcript_1634/g.3404 Transcript_1634/m.3404 type:complete len:99 (+) Transcript_1634:62-358(+)